MEDFKVPNFRAPEPVSNFVEREKTPIDGGLQHCVCIGVSEIGSHENPKFPGRAMPKVMIFWEFPDFLIEIYDQQGEPTGEERPVVLSKEFTYSMATKSNLRPFIESWVGKKFATDQAAVAFSLGKLIGFNGHANIIQETSKKDGKIYENIDSVSPKIKAVPMAEPVNQRFAFSLNDGDPKSLKFHYDRLYKFVQKKFHKSPEWADFEDVLNGQPAAAPQSKPVALPKASPISKEQEFAQTVVAQKRQSEQLVQKAAPEPEPQGGDDLPF